MQLVSLGWDDAWSSLAKATDPLATPARVLEAQRGHLLVQTDTQQLAATLRGRLLHEALSPSELPTVGDWVLLDPRPEPSSATVRAVLPRRSQLSRRAAGTAETEQLFAANVELVFLVTSLDGDLQPRRLERAFVQTRECGAEPVVVLTKGDLCADAEPALARVREVARGAPLFVVRALEGEGLEGLREALRPARTGVLLGSSGVGKSTLLNALLARSAQRTDGVREGDGRGRHTTTSRSLFALPGGGLLIDTPGVRELGLWDASEALEESFDEVRALAAGCRFRDCEHDEEPGCRVREALEAGELSSGRLEGYRKLAREAARQERRGDKAALAQQRKHWKDRCTQARARDRLRERNGR